MVQQSKTGFWILFPALPFSMTKVNDFFFPLGLLDYIHACNTIVPVKTLHYFSLQMPNVRMKFDWFACRTSVPSKKGV